MNKAAKQAETEENGVTASPVVDEPKPVDTKLPKKSGRPPRIWTDEQKDSIKQMALDNCHMDTIALALDVPKETLVRCFGTFICQKRAEGRTELRRAQCYKAKISRDTGMLCFLGKNELGQTDKKDFNIAGSLTVNIKN